MPRARPIIALFVLALAGCEKKADSRTKKPPRKAPPAVTPAAPQTAPARPPLPGPRPARPAGSKHLFTPLTGTAKVLRAAAARLLDADKPEAAATKLTMALAAFPDHADLAWDRARARARGGQAQAALRDLRRALHGDFGRYHLAAARHADLRRLQRPPNHVAFARVLAEARRAHLAALHRGHLFLSSERRLRLRRDERGIPKSFRGDQSLYAYDASTGRYLRALPDESAPVLAYLRSADRKHLAYVVADPPHSIVGERHYVASLPLDVVVVDLTTWKRVDSRRGYAPSRRRTDRSEHCIPHMDREVRLRQHRSGIWAIAYRSYRCRPGGGLPAPPGGVWAFRRRTHYLRYAARGPVAAARPPKDDPVRSSVHVRVCGYRTGLPAGQRVSPRRPVKQADGTTVTLPCSGRAWPSPDGKRVAFRPNPGCRRDGKAMGGLWVFEPGARRWSQILTKARPRRVQWLSGGSLFLRVGNGLAWSDGKSLARRLTPRRARLRAYLPKVSACRGAPLKSDAEPGPR